MRAVRPAAGLAVSAEAALAAGFLTLGCKMGFTAAIAVLFVAHFLLFSVAYAVLKKLELSGDPYLLILVGLLTGIGLILLYRIDAAAGWVTLSWNALCVRQLIALAAGLSVMIGTAAVFKETRRLESWAPRLFVFCLLLTVLTLAVGKEAGGSRAWLSVGLWNLQPSELLKVALIVYLAAYLSYYRRRYGQTPPDWWQKPRMVLAYLGPLGIMEALALSLVIFQRDLGMGFLYFALFLLLLFDATSRPVLIGLGAGAGVLGLAGAAVVFPYVRTRFDIWLHPWSDPNRTGFQMVQSLLAIRAGGLLGRGLGDGLPLRIPASHTDFIFSVWAEETGLFGSVALLILFFLLVQRGLILARLNSNPFHQLLSVGLAGLFGLQALVIIGGCMGVLPLTGVTLPFVSYGGSSIVSSFAAVGLLMVAARTGGGNSCAGF